MDKEEVLKAIIRLPHTLPPCLVVSSLLDWPLTSECITKSNTKKKKAQEQAIEEVRRQAVLDLMARKEKAREARMAAEKEWKQPQKSDAEEIQVCIRPFVSSKASIGLMCGPIPSK